MTNGKFQVNVIEEVRLREITKEKSFEASKLKINLPKFKGYDSPIDIYTFQEKFERLHSKVPKRHLPELLRNNYLDGPALDFVKRQNEIGEVWKSLKRAFGDPRMMMMKKIGELALENQGLRKSKK